MNNPAYNVETVGRLAQWTLDMKRSYDGYDIDDDDDDDYDVHDDVEDYYNYKSNPFTIVMSNWYLVVQVSPPSIGLYPEKSKTMTDNPLIASFIVRVLSSVGKNSKILAHSEAKDKLIRSENDSFILNLEVSLPVDVVVIEVEFLDLKTANPNGEEACFPMFNGSMRQRLNATTLECIGRMIREAIHTDITINVSSSKKSIGAHRAILAARSPILRSMIISDSSHKENDSSSTINISDMSIETCQAFINYLYGTIKNEEFMRHRLDLLDAAEKYDIHDLREVCEESLREDIDTKNVLGRLQLAHTYRLLNLKISCAQYLMKFGKIFDIWDDFTVFMKTANRDLICEIFHEFLP